MKIQDFLHFSYFLLFVIGHIESDFRQFFNDTIIDIIDTSLACTKEIVARNFQFGSKLAIIQSGIVRDINIRPMKFFPDFVLQIISSDPNWSVVNRRAYETGVKVIEKPGYPNVDHYIVLIRDEEDLKACFTMITESLSWNPHGKFLVVTNAMNSVEDFLYLVLTTFYKYFAINVTVMIPKADSISHRLVTWYPINAENCHDRKYVFTDIGTCDNGVVNATSDVFPDKIPKNFHGCTFHFTTTIWPPFVIDSTGANNLSAKVMVLNLTEGIEIEIMNIIAKSLNFIPIYRVHNKDKWGDMFPNNTGTGMLGDLLERKSFFAFGLMTHLRKFDGVFDFTVRYMHDHRAIVVPSVKLSRMKISLFQASVWIASITTYFLFLFLIFNISKIIKEKTKFKNFLDAVLFTWSMIANVSSPVLPKSGYLRILVILWLLFCLHWSAALRTQIYSSYTTSKYDEKVQSLQDAVKYKYKFALLKLYPKDNVQSVSEISHYLVDNRLNCKNLLDCLDHVAYERNYITVVNRNVFEYYEKNYRDANNEPLLRVLSSNIKSMPVEMIAVKGAPVLPLFNQRLRQVFEAGIIELWTERLQNKKDNLHDKRKARSLNISQMSIIFLVLGVGLSLSFAVFISEMTYFKIMQHRQVTHSRPKLCF